MDDLPVYPCPLCGYELQFATSLINPGSTPSAGDVQVCITCAGVAVFTGNELESRLPTDEERAVFDKDDSVVKIRVNVIRGRYEL